MRLFVEVSGEATVEMDVPPGLPLSAVNLSFTARSEVELRRLVDALGFDATRIDPTARLLARYGVPVTRDGERVARATVELWVEEEISQPAIPALARLRAEALAQAQAAGGL